MEVCFITYLIHWLAKDFAPMKLLQYKKPSVDRNAFSHFIHKKWAFIAELHAKLEQKKKQTPWRASAFNFKAC